MPLRRFLIQPSKIGWKLVHEQSTLIFPVREDAIETAITAASALTEKSEIVIEQADQSEEIVWSSDQRYLKQA